MARRKKTRTVYRYAKKGYRARKGMFSGSMKNIVWGAGLGAVSPFIPNFLGGWTKPVLFGAGGYLLKKPVMLHIAGYEAGKMISSGFFGGGTNSGNGGWLQMAATTGTVSAKGLQTGQYYHVDAYVPDAVAGVWTFDSGGGAGSGTNSYYQFPENVEIYDISMAGAPTATRGRITSNGVPSASVFRFGNHLYSLNNRPHIGCKLRAGHMFGIVNL